MQTGELKPDDDLLREKLQPRCANEAQGVRTGEVLGTPNAEMRKNLSGDQPKLFTPWLTMDEKAVTE